MNKVNDLRDSQRAIAKQAILDDQMPIDSIKKICGFDCAQKGKDLVCAAVVVEYPSMKILEYQTLTKPAPMNYIPGFLAFREGPLMLELYYKLEQDPDVLMVDGHGVAHPAGCGLATYIGVELGKPTIGVANSLLVGDIDGQKILIGGHLVGHIVKTKEHAKDVYVTAGHLITADTAAELVRLSVRLPHKLPEPLHLAHRFADKEASRVQDTVQNTV